MGKLSSFVRLDFYTIKPYKKSLLILTALSVGMTLGFSSLSTLCSYTMMCLLMITIYPFSIGEVNRLDTLYSTLSVSRRNVVAGRYVFFVCLEALVIAFILALSFAFTTFTDMSMEIHEMSLLLCVLSLVVSFAVSLQYPIYFKLGYNKAKFLAYVPLFLIFFSVMFVSKIFGNFDITSFDFGQISAWIESNVILTCGLLIAAGFLLLYISYVISYRFYQKRDI